ncbi:MAG: helix-turn-helix domain-containing protein [Oscillospiraceae bacterium]|jgi:transcriptional regulator with XRE-family HTH domain|nr:helix-turn-helix domain-containing protein [Oscillospiraceae bacterium]
MRNQYKFYRERAGLTQAEAAARLKEIMPNRRALRSAIAQWENGYAKPIVDVLLPLAEVYGCTVDELLRWPKDDEKEVMKNEH